MLAYMFKTGIFFLLLFVHIMKLLASQINPYVIVLTTVIRTNHNISGSAHSCIFMQTHLFLAFEVDDRVLFIYFRRISCYKEKM